jgi:hypothetical protein
MFTILSNSSSIMWIEGGVWYSGIFDEFIPLVFIYFIYIVNYLYTHIKFKNVIFNSSYQFLALEGKQTIFNYCYNIY